jgi:hypothetical protein
MMALQGCDLAPNMAILSQRFLIFPTASTKSMLWSFTLRLRAMAGRALFEKFTQNTCVDAAFMLKCFVTYYLSQPCEIFFIEIYGL